MMMIISQQPVSNVLNSFLYAAPTVTEKLSQASGVCSMSRSALLERQLHELDERINRGNS